MVASSSFGRAQRLPARFAWIAVAIDLGMFIVGMAAQLLPLSPNHEQMREVYARAGVWVPLLSRAATTWLLAATLAWCHARQALDARGPARIAQLRAPGLRFGAVFLAAMLLNGLALTPLLYQVQLLFMPGGALHARVDEYGMRSLMAVAMLAHSVVQLLVLVASIWLAARFALRERGLAAVEQVEGTRDGGRSARGAIAFVAAMLFTALQLWVGHVASGWVDTSRDAEVLPLLLGWFAVPLLVGALACWGAWLGAAPGPAQARPFRALAATASAFVLLQAVCIALGVAGVLWIASAAFMGRSSDGRLLLLAAALAAVYLVLLVVFVRAMVRRFYRRLYL